ncbi:MAG TPA: PAS domain S-box protein [Verrucomicrobiae bacterium]|nr:PAS domain S-box protein [Verrucomicrobiae bacterium]
MTVKKNNQDPAAPSAPASGTAEKAGAEDYLRSVVANTPECIKIVAGDGTLLEINQAGCNMIDAAAPADVIGRSVFELAVPEHHAAVGALLKQVCSGKPGFLEFDVVGLKGERRTIESTAVPFTSPRWSGTVQLAISRDVTNRKQAEEKLRQSEARFQRQAKNLELLGRISESLTSELDLETLVQAATDAGREATGAEFGAFFYNVTNARGESYMLYTLSGAPREAFEKFPMPRNTAVFNPTIQGAGIIRIGDVLLDPRYGKNPPHHGMPKGHLPVRSYLAAPVISRSGVVLGGLFFGHKQPNVFTEEAEQMLAAIAAQASIAIDNAQLYGRVQAELAAQKQAEEKLRANEERLALELRGVKSLYDLGNQLLDAGNNSTQCAEYILDAAMAITGASRGFLQLPDVPGALAVVAQRGWEQPVLNCVAQIVADALPPGQSLRVENVQQHEAFTAPARQKTMQEAGVRAMQSIPLLSSSGQLLGVVSTHFDQPRPVADREVRLLDLLSRQAADFLERKRTEEMSARLAAIVDHSGDAIISKDLSGIIKTWNKGAERVFGYSAAEAIGKPVTMLIPSERLDEEPGILDRVRHGERIDHYETVRRRKDGVCVDISLAVSPIRDMQGEVIGASKIARDITDRKAAEAALRRSEGLLRELADSMPQIVWASPPDGRVDYFNRRWHEFTGHAPGYAHWQQALHPDDAAQVAAKFAEGLKSQKPFTAEFRLKGQRSEAHRWFLARTEPIRDEAGNVIRWFGTFTDIDDQKRAEEKLERTVAERTASLREAVAQMEEFSYTVSHDLRAPLRGMDAYSRALLEDFAPALPAEAQEALTRIAANAARLDRMIVDILTYTRISRADFHQGKVSLDKLARQIVEQYPGMQQPQAQIVIEPLPDVIGHEPSLTQALSNLLNNAIKFVPAGVTPQVRVWPERKDGKIRIWVADNGIGIAPRHQHKLFRMFERMHPNMKFEGTGVGLAIVRKAMERMGGQAGVESDGVHGSQFWIELPDTTGAP